MSNGIHTYLTIIIIPVAFSCSIIQDRKKVPIARVDHSVLYLSEIQNAIPDNFSGEDSLLYAEDYIRNWINYELLLKKAHENLTLSQSDLVKEIREYRNSLIIYRYQDELMQQKLDTFVSEAEITVFYDSVKQDFILDKDLVKVIMVKIPLKVKNPENVKVFCDASSARNLEELDQYCRKNGAEYNLYGKSWVDPRQVFRELPFQPKDLHGFLSGYTIWETRDSGFYYLVRILDYAPAGTPSPVEYIGSNLKEMIINKRKNQFLGKIKQDIYTEGLLNNKFKIYDYDLE
jgi:hypothetical protein